MVFFLDSPKALLFSKFFAFPLTISIRLSSAPSFERGSVLAECTKLE